MDCNILNCSGDELTALLVAISTSISKNYSIEDITTLSCFFVALGDLLALQASQMQRFEDCNNSNDNNNNEDNNDEDKKSN